MQRKIRFPDNALTINELTGMDAGDSILRNIPYRYAFPVFVKLKLLVERKIIVVETILLSVIGKIVFIERIQMQEESCVRIVPAARFLDISQTVSIMVNIEMGTDQQFRRFVVSRKNCSPAFISGPTAEYFALPIEIAAAQFTLGQHPDVPLRLAQVDTDCYDAELANLPCEFIDKRVKFFSIASLQPAKSLRHSPRVLTSTFSALAAIPGTMFK